MEQKPLPINIDEKIIKCAVCDRTYLKDYGILKVVKGSQFQIENLEMYLCTSCLFSILSHLKTQRELLHLFDES